MRRICVVGFCATRLRINGCARCVARRLLASAPPGSPNLSTSPLIGLLGDIRAEKSPLESYLPGPGERLFASLRHSLAKRDRGQHAAAIGHQSPSGLKSRSGMKDHRTRWHVSQAADLEARLYGGFIGVVRGRDDNANTGLAAPAQVRELRQGAFRGSQRHRDEVALEAGEHDLRLRGSQTGAEPAEAEAVRGAHYPRIQTGAAPDAT